MIVEHPHVNLSEKDDAYLIEGTRIPVRRLFQWNRQGTTVETLLRRYPQLGPARIFSALAFAYDNLNRMSEELLKERDRLAAEK